MKANLVFLLLMGLPFLLFAQSWQKVKSVHHSGLDNIAIDYLGNIYMTDERGNVVKYDQNGKLLLEYTPVQVAKVHELTLTSQFKVILFYDDLQELVILDRYLSTPARYRLSDFELGFIEHVTQNIQQALWVLDISDFSIKLIDVREKRMLEQKSLAQVLDQNMAEILSFRAHQNRMYLIDRHSGVQVFDNIGNYLSKLIESGSEEMGFDKDYFYYRAGKSLKFVHLYQEESKTVELPPVDFLKLHYSNGRLVLITPQGFEIYKYLSGD